MHDSRTHGEAYRTPKRGGLLVLAALAGLAARTSSVSCIVSRLRLAVGVAKCCVVSRRWRLPRTRQRRWTFKGI